MICFCAIMVSIKVIKESSDAFLPSPWVDSADFKGRNQICSEEGTSVENNFSGRTYRQVAQKEYKFSCLERVARAFLGVVVLIVTLFIAIRSQGLRELFTANKKFILFVVPHNDAAKKHENEKNALSDEPRLEKKFRNDFAYVKDAFKETLTGEDALSKAELEEGITIPQEAIPTLKKVLANPYSKKHVQWISQGNNYVFSIESAPGIIFKFSKYNQSLQSRFKNMILAQTACRVNRLGLLVIPKARLISVSNGEKGIEIMVEKKLNFAATKGKQEELIQQHDKKVDEVIQQLATLICKMDYSDVKLINNPVLDDEVDENGNRKLGLIDLEVSDNVLLKRRKEIGLFGNRGRLIRTGLMGCIANKRQAKIIRKVALENGVDTTELIKSLKIRLSELKIASQLNELHKANNVVDGSEAISSDPLDFSAYPEPAKLEKLAQEVIKEANLQIAISDSIAKNEKRVLFITADELKKFPQFYHLTRESITGYTVPEKLKDKDFDKAWAKFYESTALGVVIKKLHEAGRIFSYKKTVPGYRLQA